MSENPKRFFRQEALEHFARGESYDEPLKLVIVKPWRLYLACALLVGVALLAYVAFDASSLTRMIAT